MPPSFNRFSGALHLPTTTTGETTLESLDPAQEILIALFKKAIETELGPRWAAAANGTPLAGHPVVAATLDQEPTQEHLQQEPTKFPMLAVYRTGEVEVEQLSLSIDEVTQRWGVDYVLGPLDVASKRKVGGALDAVAKTINEVVRVGGHPAYGMDQGNVQPKQVLTTSGQGCCDFASVRVVGWSTGQAAFATEGQGPTYWWMTLQLETTEENGRTDPFLGTAPHKAAEFCLGTGNEDGVIEGLFDFESVLIEDEP